MGSGQSASFEEERAFLSELTGAVSYGLSDTYWHRLFSFRGRVLALHPPLDSHPDVRQLALRLGEPGLSALLTAARRRTEQRVCSGRPT